MKSYIDTMKNILDNGEWKDARTEEKCLTVSHQTCSFDLREGFPLLTQRFIPFKSICVELEGFLKGITSKKWYQDRGCKYWDYWANPVVVDNHPILQNFDQDESSGIRESDYYLRRKEAQLQVDDLGAAYMWQWRKFDQHYPTTWDQGPNSFSDRQSLDWDLNGIEKGTDQIQNILDTLKSNPNDRRMLCIAFNPNQLYLSALPACHYSFGLTKIGDHLDLAFTMRSWDFFLGASSNIASYAVLLHLFAKHAGLIPRKLTGFGLDVHLYENQIEAAKELIERPSFKLPEVDFTHDDFWDWDHTKIKLLNYEHGDKLSMPVAI